HRPSEAGLYFRRPAPPRQGTSKDIKGHQGLCRRVSCKVRIAAWIPGRKLLPFSAAKNEPSSGGRKSAVFLSIASRDRREVVCLPKPRNCPIGCIWPGQNRQLSP